jgi:hypothetical protein
MILRADGKDVVGFGKLALEAAAGSPGLATGSSSATGWVVVYCLSPNSIDILKNYQFARHS